MNTRNWFAWHLVLFSASLAVPLLAIDAEPQEPKKQPDQKEFGKKDFGFGGGFGKQRQKLIPQFDKDNDGRLNTEERQVARAFVQKNGKGGPGGFGGKGGFGGGKGGFGGKGGPGGNFAKPLIDAVDTNQDASIAKAELLAGIKKFFSETDKAKKGTLDQEQLVDALGRILPPPPGFGGGFQPPAGFGPARPLADAIMGRADLNKKGTVTLAQLEKAAEALFAELDKGKKGKLDESTVAAGISQLFPPPGGFGGKGGPGGFGKGGFGKEPAKPGPKVDPADAKSYPEAKLYDTSVLRTIFVEFENKKDWEAELADFYHTDVEVPATVIVDGKKYANVGIRFRGNSSYFMAPAGYKHSFNFAFDYADSKQRLLGYKTLNLLNCADDPTLMHTVLFCNIARKYFPAPQANFVKVVVNGESWGIYANQQQFNKEFLQENYKTTKGARWKVPGRPGANGGLAYLGENIKDYKGLFEIKTKDNEKDWKALIELCRVLNKTPPDKLEAALRPILDLDAVLWFLALDNAAINDDGYWTRSSDYSLFRDPKGMFHIVPHDTNETFMPVGGGKGGGFGKGPKDGGFGKGPKDGGFGKGPKDGGFGKGPKDGGGFGGFGMGPKGGGYGLDPLVDLNNTRAPLLSRLLAVPELKAKYLKNMHTIASKELDWKNLGPIVEGYRKLIEKEVELDTRKLTTLAEFRNATASSADGPASRFSLRAFADGRRAYLLNHAEIKKAAAQ
jgi:spore coat protein CotH